jgi:hypothetical protein
VRDVGLGHLLLVEQMGDFQDLPQTLIDIRFPGRTLLSFVLCKVASATTAEFTYSAPFLLSENRCVCFNTNCLNQH